MAHHTLSVDFIVRKHKNDPLQACIYARITIDGDEREISLKEIIAHEKWDSSSENVKGKTQDVKDLNAHIDNVRNKIRNIYRGLCDTQDYVSVQEVKDAYTGKTNKKHTVLALIDQHRKKFEKDLKPGTIKNFGATRTYIANFIRDTFKQPDVNVSQLSFAFISDLESYIPENPIKDYDPCHGNGTAKHLERFKGIVTWGVDMGWLKKQPFGRFKPHRTKTKIKKLRPHQLKLIETKTLSNPKLEFVRDLFLFSCYTGFAFAEVIRISMNDFEISSAGKFWCTMYRQKSSELEAVPVLSQAVDLIKKYKDQPVAVANGTIFPPTSNQEVNRCLKILQEIYEIPFNLTFHVARHTFATVAVKNGIDIKIVKALMGHVKITTTDKYADVDEEMLEEAMEKVSQAKKKRQELPSPQQYIM